MFRLGISGGFRTFVASHRKCSPESECLMRQPRAPVERLGVRKADLPQRAFFSVVDGV
jgi:hypothetical protein